MTKETKDINRINLIRGLSTLSCVAGFIAIMLGASTRDAQDELEGLYERTNDPVYEDLLDKTASPAVQDGLMFGGLGAIGLGLFGFRKSK